MRTTSPLAENLDRLKSARNLKNRPLVIKTLPMPAPVAFEGQRLPASYANLLHCERAGAGADLQRPQRPHRTEHYRGVLPASHRHGHPLHRLHLGSRRVALHDTAGARMSKPWPPPPDFASINELVATADIEEFIAEGSPADEYEIEAEELFEAIKDFPTADLTVARLMPCWKKSGRERSRSTQASWPRVNPNWKRWQHKSHASLGRKPNPWCAVTCSELARRAASFGGARGQARAQVWASASAVCVDARHRGSNVRAACL